MRPWGWFATLVRYATKELSQRWQLRLPTSSHYGQAAESEVSHSANKAQVGVQGKPRKEKREKRKEMGKPPSPFSLSFWEAFRSSAHAMHAIQSCLPFLSFFSVFKNLPQIFNDRKMVKNHWQDYSCGWNPDTYNLSDSLPFSDLKLKNSEKTVVTSYSLCYLK